MKMLAGMLLIITGVALATFTAGDTPTILGGVAGLAIGVGIFSVVNELLKEWNP